MSGAYRDEEDEDVVDSVTVIDEMRPAKAPVAVSEKAPVGADR